MKKIDGKSPSSVGSSSPDPGQGKGWGGIGGMFRRIATPVPGTETKTEGKEISPSPVTTSSRVSSPEQRETPAKTSFFSKVFGSSSSPLQGSEKGTPSPVPPGASVSEKSAEKPLPPEAVIQLKEIFCETGSDATGLSEVLYEFFGGKRSSELFVISEVSGEGNAKWGESRRLEFIGLPEKKVLVSSRAIDNFISAIRQSLSVFESPLTVSGLTVLKGKASVLFGEEFTIRFPFDISCIVSEKTDEKGCFYHLDFENRESQIVCSGLPKSLTGGEKGVLASLEFYPESRKLRAFLDIQEDSGERTLLKISLGNSHDNLINFFREVFSSQEE